MTAVPRSLDAGGSDRLTRVIKQGKIRFLKVHDMGSDDMPEGQATQRHPDFVPALQGWHLAKERARRYNRNLLQYAAGIAAVLGIGAGSSGLFAVAGALIRTEETSRSLPDWAFVILAVAGGVVGVLSIILLAFLAIAFSRRGTAEQDADLAQARLIDLDPDRFWPKEE